MPSSFGRRRRSGHFARGGRRANSLRRPVVFLLGEHPEDGLGQVAGAGDGGAGVALARLEPRVEIADVLVERTAQVGGADGGLDEGPFQIEIDEAGGAAERGLAAGGKTRGTSPA